MNFIEIIQKNIIPESEITGCFDKNRMYMHIYISKSILKSLNIDDFCKIFYDEETNKILLKSSSEESHRVSKYHSSKRNKIVFIFDAAIESFKIKKLNYKIQDNSLIIDL